MTLKKRTIEIYQCNDCDKELLKQDDGFLLRSHGGCFGTQCSSVGFAFTDAFGKTVLNGQEYGFCKPCLAKRLGLEVPVKKVEQKEPDDIPHMWGVKPPAPPDPPPPPPGRKVG